MEAGHRGRRGLLVLTLATLVCGHVRGRVETPPLFMAAEIVKDRRDKKNSVLEIPAALVG